MSEIDSVGPAFPVTPTDNSGKIGPTEYGLTKREWYAGMALQGISSRDSIQFHTCEKHYGIFVYDDECYSMCPFCETKDRLNSAFKEIIEIRSEQANKYSPCQPTGVVGKSESVK